MPLSRHFFHEANDAFLVIEPSNLQLMDVNATTQRLTGWRKKVLLAMKLDELLEGIDSESTRKLVQACHSTHFFHSIEGYTLRRSSGPSLAVNVSVSRIHGEEATLGLVVVRDVTERKRVEESLYEANERLQTALDDLKRQQEIVIQQERMRALGQMANAAAHKLNNLLTPIVGYSELLLGRTDLSREMREQLTHILTAAHGAADVVRNLQTVHGLGPELSVEHGTVRRHGGTIEVDSDLEREPAARTILPAVERILEDDVSQGEGPVSKPSPCQLRILYIDDDEAAREALGALLRALGFHVDLAEDGPTGIAMFQTADPEIVITDLAMPDMDGREVTRIVKQARPQMPVVLISGWGDTLTREEFDEQARPDFFISKPTCMDELTETLDKARVQLARSKDV